MFYSWFLFVDDQTDAPAWIDLKSHKLWKGQNFQFFLTDLEMFCILSFLIAFHFLKKSHFHTHC